MKKKLEFEIMSQTNGYTCLAASMKSILFYLRGKRVSQKRIFDIGHSAEKHLKSYISQGKKQKVEGIGSMGVIAISKEFGLEGFITKKGSFDKLKFFIERGLPVLVDYQCNPDALGESGHYGVVFGFEDESIYLADPRKWIKNQIQKVDYPQFESVWYDPSPSYNRWMASFWKKNRSFEIPYRGKFI